MFNLKATVSRLIKKRKLAQDKILATAVLNQYVITDHALERMLERDVSPRAFIDTIDNGRQIIAEDGSKYLEINLGSVLLVLYMRDKLVLTVIKDDKFKDWTIEDFKKYRKPNLIAVAQMTVKQMRSIKNLKELSERFEKFKKLIEK